MNQDLRIHALHDRKIQGLIIPYQGLKIRDPTTTIIIIIITLRDLKIRVPTITTTTTTLRDLKIRAPTTIHQDLKTRAPTTIIRDLKIRAPTVIIRDLSPKIPTIVLDLMVIEAPIGSLLILLIRQHPTGILPMRSLQNRHPLLLLLHVTGKISETTVRLLQAQGTPPSRLILHPPRSKILLATPPPLTLSALLQAIPAMISINPVHLQR